MIAELARYYFALCVLALAMAVCTPIIARCFIQYAQRLAGFLFHAAAAFLALLLLQQLFIILISWGNMGSKLWLPPLSFLLQAITGSPATQNGLVQQTWWVEELRLLSAICFTLPLLALSLNNDLLKIGYDADGSKKQFAVNMIGALGFALPLGLLITWFGLQASLHSIIGRLPRTAQELDRSEWVWEGSANFVGFGYAWSFKALVPLIGLVIVVGAFIRLQQSILNFRGSDITGSKPC